MVNERKCPACAKWTDGHKTHCTHCGALTDPALIAEEIRKEREEEREAYMFINESKAIKKLKGLKESDKTFHRIIFYIADTLFTIYMAILSFIVWLIALVSG
ncbi:hypothetical protein G3O08_03170 [Cryomorpha ignava]|uniref:Uncharacterized protein n=1 Tax=Cryomorpha ignava TaxID=101383 RepID=A0A7K3WLI2_9FLAO|nr:hypothetical protein [Cryomorpha ignava]NEN22503.1 hypothetical protein [Cryomorpha ignava]